MKHIKDFEFNLKSLETEQEYSWKLPELHFKLCAITYAGTKVESLQPLRWVAAFYSQMAKKKNLNTNKYTRVPYRIIIQEPDKLDLNSSSTSIIMDNHLSSENFSFLICKVIITVPTS